MEADYLKQVVEGLVFASDTPISEQKISSIIEEVSPGEAKKMINQLNTEYARSKRGFLIDRVAGGFQVRTRKDLAPWIAKLFKGRIKTRLSQAGLESLAIIVFKQPISRVEIDAIRGVNSGGVLKNLLERNLINIAGRSDGPGKAILYGTTKEFLNYLGINDVKELPKLKEIEEIMGKLDAAEGVAENILEALTTVDEVEVEVEDDSATGTGQAREVTGDNHGDNGKIE